MTALIPPSGTINGFCLSRACLVVKEGAANLFPFEDQLAGAGQGHGTVEFSALAGMRLSQWCGIGLHLRFDISGPCARYPQFQYAEASHGRPEAISGWTRIKMSSCQSKEAVSFPL